MNAQRNVHPIATRRSPKTRCSPLVWIGSSRSIGGISTAVTSRVVCHRSHLLLFVHVRSMGEERAGGTGRTARSWSGLSGVRAGPSDRGRSYSTEPGSGGVAGEVGGGLGAPGDLELGQDRAHVVLDGLLGEMELVADLAVRATVGDLA